MDAVTHAAMLARGGPLTIMKEAPDADYQQPGSSTQMVTAYL